MKDMEGLGSGKNFISTIVTIIFITVLLLLLLIVSPFLGVEGLISGLRSELSSLQAVNC